MIKWYLRWVLLFTKVGLRRKKFALHPGTIKGSVIYRKSEAQQRVLLVTKAMEKNLNLACRTITLSGTKIMKCLWLLWLCLITIINPCHTILYLYCCYYTILSAIEKWKNWIPNFNCTDFRCETQIRYNSVIGTKN